MTLIRRIVSARSATTNQSQSYTFNASDNLMSGQAEIDSHADNCGVNDTAYIIEYTNRVVEVAPFSDSWQAMEEIPIVRATLAYDDPATSETFILMIGQALYFGDKSKQTLLNPNQMRANGVIVDDVPRHLSPNHSSTHSLYFSDENIRIPLELNGCISYFNVQKPTLHEIHTCTTLSLTDDSIEWNPYSSIFAANETAVDDSTNIKANDRVLYSFTSSYYRDPTLDLTDVIHNGLQQILAVSTGTRKAQVSAEDLAKKWAIGHQVAKDTIQATTQSFVRSALHPIERRFKIKNSTLRYNNLKSKFYSDTMFSNTKSILNHTMAQLFVNDQGYMKITPMKLKSEAGLALKELIQDVGIPHHMHTDEAKETTLGTWKKTCKEHSIAMSNTEPYSPFQNRAEAGIGELKRHVNRFMARTNAPKKLWDFCAVYTADLRNRLALPLYQLHGRTPIEALTGNTPDISEFLEFKWYQPIWVYDSAPFPEQR